MTNAELMLADAEYWFGSMEPGELVLLAGEGGIARIAALESEFGIFCGVDCLHTPEKGTAEYFESRSWFSLLIGEAEAHTKLITDWPFPTVIGEVSQ